MNLKAGINGASENRVVAGKIEGRGDDGDYGAIASEKLGEVHHGDHVALRHEREEKKVKCIAVGRHGRVVWYEKAVLPSYGALVSII